MKIAKILNLETFFALIIVLLSFTQLRLLSKIGIGEIFILIFFCISFLFAIKNRILFLNVKFLYLYLVFGYLIFLGFFLSLHNYNTIYGIVFIDILAYGLSFLLLLSLSLSEEFDLNKAIDIFVYSIIIFSFLSLIFLPNDIVYYLNSRFKGLSNNPNQLAFTILFAQFTYLYFHKLCFKTFIILLILFILGYLSGSDAYFYSSIISYFLLIYLGALSFLKIDNILKTLTIIFSLIIFFLIFLIFFDSNFLLNSWQTYDEDNTRISLYLNGLKSWYNSISSIFFGNGVGRFSGVAFPFHFREAHNSFIDILNNFGIFGFLLIFIPTFYKVIDSYINEDYVLLILIISLFIYIFFHMVTRQPYFWIMWYLIFLHKRVRI